MNYLLSKYYCPKIKKLYKIGIVPHFTDYDNSIINDFINEHSDVIKIKIDRYTNAVTLGKDGQNDNINSNITLDRYLDYFLVNYSMMERLELLNV